MFEFDRTADRNKLDRDQYFYNRFERFVSRKAKGITFFMNEAISRNLN